MAEERDEAAELIASGLLRSFVRVKGGTWDHQDWRTFLDGVRRAGYRRLSDDEVGQLLETEKGKQAQADLHAQSWEKAFLTAYATLVIIWLVALALGSLGTILAILGQWLVIAPSVELLVLCIVSATLGSSISALSQGWEFSKGGKYPKDEPPDKFVARMVPFFVIRPLLGSAVGFVAYVGIVGGYLIAAEGSTKQNFSREALLFISFLSGLFAKTFVEKLRDMFDAFFGKSKAPAGPKKSKAPAGDEGRSA